MAVNGDATKLEFGGKEASEIERRVGPRREPTTKCWESGSQERIIGRGWGIGI